MKRGRRFWLGVGGVAALGIPAGAWMVYRHDPEIPVGPRGALRRDPARVFDLLEGFSYRVIDRVGRPMTDGYPVPPRPDGMACFPGDDGSLILLRNHELPTGTRAHSVGRAWPTDAYDAEAGGAVTRLVLDAETLSVRSSNLVLAGTSMNCSGGPSPWGWISCEEDPRDARHGFAFLCDPSASEAQPPVRIDSYGRFKHEAAGVATDSAVCYLTEDRDDGCLYRFVPHEPSSPFEGRLQAMRVRGRRVENLAPLVQGERREIEWFDLTDPTPSEDTLRYTAQAAGAAIVRRGEGVCLTGGAVYACSTTGGPIASGQLFRLEDGPDGGTLEVIAASTDRAVMDMPDNITASPSGTIYFVEDGRGHDLLRYLQSDGRVVALGRNASSEGEIAGVCFDPHGETCFVNLQEEGLTLAITGPFAELSG